MLGQRGDKFMNDAKNELNEKLIIELMKKYNDDLFPMYVEFPHKSFWSEKLKEEDYKNALKNLFSTDYKKKAPLLLYVHIPYCPKQCWFCICYSKVTKDYEQVKRYLDYLFREIDMLKKFFDENGITPNFHDIHLGGGSPTYLKEEDFDSLIEKLKSIVDFKNIREFTIEIDPRAVTGETLKYYHSKGINRISLGIQDFDPEVQKAVNRIQPVELIEKLLTPEIRKNFSGVNFDILCGLPRQTRESFRKTIETVIKLSPDRICNVFVTYATSYRKHQKLIKEKEVPDIYERTILFYESVQTLIKNGYVRIGFDHFAKSTDQLAKAFSNKSIHWNGLGYRAGEFMDTIGIGTSSASRVTPYYYSQNYYELPLYEKAIDEGKLPIYRGYKMNSNDVIRREIIHTMRSFFSLDFHKIEQLYNIKFKEYFKKELKTLQIFEKDNLLNVSDDMIDITELGKYFIYQICQVFDTYIPYKSK